MNMIVYQKNTGILSGRITTACKRFQEIISSPSFSASYESIEPGQEVDLPDWQPQGAFIYLLIKNKNTFT